ncbi:hypothetical protein D3C84_1110590 [compost metagenome]
MPHPKAKYYDPLSFGTASYEPDMISHIDVVDAAGNRVDVMAVPQRRLLPDDVGYISGCGLVPDTQYPELLGMTREEPPAAHDVLGEEDK